MGESHREATRIAMSNSGGGEIVEVQGGHIVRSTGRKDRHSKVCTAKGPRDRRVRLSANTAIQFYDVQDRLGYDRPSKAVDWLIKKAKASIDELAELPAWEPTATTPTSATKTRATTQKNQHEREHEFVSKSKRRMSDSSTMELYSGDIHGMQHEVGGENTNQSNSGLSFLPVSLESDPIADTFKSFFPMGASTGAEATSTINHFENYSPDLLPRASSQSQDLRLSLQSFQEPILLHQQPHHNEQQVLLPGAAMVAHQLSFDGFGWPDQYHHNHHNTQDINRFQRLMSWNAGGGIDSGSSASGSGGYTFNLPPRPQPTPVSGQQPVLQPLFGQNQFFTQRGPLQSSNTPSIRAYADPVIAIDNHYHIQQSQHHQTVLSSVGLTSAVSGSSGRFSELRIPARIQGDEEHDGIANKPSSASSDYRR